MKYNIYKSLVVPILFQGCETWARLLDTVRKIQAFESKCLKKAAVHVIQKTKKTCDQEPLLATVKQRKLILPKNWFTNLTK